MPRGKSAPVPPPPLATGILSLPEDVLRYHICPLLSRADIAALCNATCSRMRAVHRSSFYTNCQDPPHLHFWLKDGGEWHVDYTRSRLIPRRREDNDVYDSGGHETNEVAVSCTLDFRHQVYNQQREAALLTELRRAYGRGYRIRRVLLRRPSAQWIISALSALLHARHRLAAVEIRYAGHHREHDDASRVYVEEVEDPLAPDGVGGRCPSSPFKGGAALIEQIARVPQPAREYLASIRSVLVQSSQTVAPLMVVNELFDPTCVWHAPSVWGLVPGASASRVLFATGGHNAFIESHFRKTRALAGLPPLLIPFTGPARLLDPELRRFWIPSDYRRYARALLEESAVPAPQINAMVRSLRWAAHVAAFRKSVGPRGVQDFIAVHTGLQHITLESQENGFALPRLARALWRRLTDLRSIWVNIDCECVPDDYDHRLDPFRARQFETLVEQARSRRPADVTVVYFRRVATEVVWDFSVVLKWTDAADADVREMICRAVDLLGMHKRPRDVPPRRSERIIRKTAAKQHSRRTK